MGASAPAAVRLALAEWVPGRVLRSVPRSCASPSFFGELRSSRRARAVEAVIGVERNQPAIRRREMDARTLDGAEVEIEAVEKLDDRDLERVLIGKAGRRLDSGQAAEQACEPALAIILDRRQRQQIEDAGLERRIALEADRVRRRGDDVLAVHQPGDRDDARTRANAV